MIPIRIPGAKVAKPNKYRNKKTEYAGILFDSKAEASRYAVLQLLERTGKITELKRQVPYALAPSVKYHDSKRAKPALRLTVDFQYRDENGELVCEDTKGIVTQAFQIRRHLLLSVHGLQLRLTK